MSQGNSFTGRVYLGTNETTSPSIRAVAGVPAFVLGDNAGDQVLSDNGRIYVCDGAAWSPLINADGGTTMTSALVVGLPSPGPALSASATGSTISTSTATDAYSVTDTAGGGVVARIDTGSGAARITAEDSGATPIPLNLEIDALQINNDPGTSGQVLTSAGPSGAPTWQNPTGGGAVYAGALTVYVDGTNGTDAPGGGTLGAPYRTINYAYSQVPSLGDVNNVVYNANVEQYITEKLILQLAPGRYVENVVLGFKRARVQLVGGGVQIVGNVTLSAVRADFPAANMQTIRASFPTPWTGAGALVTFEVTGGGLAGLSGIESSGGAESDATSDTLLVTGLTTLLFDEPTVPGGGVTFPNWDGNYGQFNFYANRANLIGGQVIATSYTVPTTNGLPTCVIEIEGSTIGESSNFVRSYLGAVPYAYVLASTPTTNWAKGTGVATGAGQSTTALVDTTKTWAVNEYAGATLRLTSGTGSGQTATVISNTVNTLTFAALATAPVANSTVYSLVGATNKAPTGTITLKTHNSTIGAAVGPRIVLGELDGCRFYDIDRTMLGTVDNGAVTGSTSTSYIGLVINQFRIYSGTGIPASQYQLGAATGTTRYKLDSTSYTTLAFNRSGAGVLTARTLNLGGGVSFDFQDDGRSLAYTPGTSANWAAPAPATVQAALDRIAAAVFTLRGNSAIP